MADNAAAGDGGCSSSGYDARPTPGPGNLAGCGTVTSMECYRAIINKCTEELVKTADLISRIRFKRRYPHTGFYMNNWGRLNQTCYRTVDTLKAVHNMNNQLRPDIMENIYWANVRFQNSLRHLVMTRALLSASLDQFIARIQEYELLQRREAELAHGSADGAERMDESDDGVSSTTVGNPSNASTSQNLADKLLQVQRDIVVIQSFLNQIPAFVALARMEEHWMHIYDEYDDSLVVHQLLTDPSALSLLHATNSRPDGTDRLPPVVHNWDDVVSEEAVKRKFQHIMQSLRNRRNGGPEPDLNFMMQQPPPVPRPQRPTANGGVQAQNLPGPAAGMYRAAPPQPRPQPPQQQQQQPDQQQQSVRAQLLRRFEQ